MISFTRSKTLDMFDLLILKISKFRAEEGGRDGEGEGEGGGEGGTYPPPPEIDLELKFKKGFKRSQLSDHFCLEF
jgi:hypothetical protein